MKKFKAVVIWVLRSWPPLVVLIIGAVHLMLFYTIGGDWKVPNKIISCAMQIVGGSVVITSINANLGTFRSYGFLTVFGNYWGDRPWRKFPSVATVVEAGVGALTITGHAATITQTKSLEDRLQELESKIAACFQHIVDREHAIGIRLDAVRNEFAASLVTHGDNLERLSSRVEKSLVEGFPLQSFGVLVASYGVVLGYFT
ncbi:MAG: hypothetical protein JWR21_3294 [Herminiimonas sp.]|nr:hypothetical protein [Herminiimonas sp.]